MDKFILPEEDNGLAWEYCRFTEYRYQKDIYDLAKTLFQRTKCAIDIGSHVGFWSSYMAEDFDCVHSFEPIKENYDCLVKNCLSNVVCHNFAIGKKETEKELMLESKSNSGAWSFVRHEFKKINYKELVKIKTLDSFELEPDYIKIDVQGFETAVLAGAIETLKRSRPVITVECETLGSERCAVRLLKSIGYRCVFRKPIKFRGKEPWMSRAARGRDFHFICK